MKGLTITGSSPQQKIVGVNNKFGNTNIKNQQGTTRTLFDSLPIDGRRAFRFFENSQSRTYPLTNLQSEGNRLNVGETFVIQKMYLVGINYDAATNSIVGFETPSNISNANLAIQLGELDFFIANSQVIKSLPLHWTNNSFNYTGLNTEDIALSLETDIVIPPLLDYVAEIRTTAYTLPAAARQLMLVIQGTAGILAPQTTF